MLVSYVIPVYNMEKYVQQCINSISYQALSNNEEMEIIIVNDGSTDNSMEIIQETLNNIFTSSHIKTSITGFTIIDFKHNHGAGNALCEGFKAANGDYICYLSADDMLSNIMKTHNQLCEMMFYNDIGNGADLSYCNKFYTGYSNNPRKDTIISSFIFKYNIFNNFILKNNYLIYLFLNFKNPINSSTLMFKRSAIDTYGNWDPAIKSDCDGDILLKYALSGAKIKEIEFTRPAIYYRLHENQLSNNLNYMTETMKYNRFKYNNIVLAGNYPVWLKILVRLFVKG
jgi:glycosyltransferase involved in cell wall biosynthesis